MTPCKINIWVLPVTLHTQECGEHSKIISPSHIEIVFLTASGATLNILNIDTRNEYREYHKFQLKTSTFFLSEANKTILQSHRTVKLDLYPDATEHRKHQNTVFTLTFHVLKKLNIVGTLFLKIIVESKNFSPHTLEIKPKQRNKIFAIL